MPIPRRVIVIAGTSLAAAAAGVKKGVDGLRKRREATKLVDEARADFERHQASLEQLEDECNAALADLGNHRQLVFSETMPAFIDVVSRLRNAEVVAEAVREQIEPRDVPIESMMHDIAIKEIDVLGAVAAGALGAAAASEATITAVAAFASASTGTSVASLSGAAAGNAGLAWLGGGSMASGGLGMAGGSAVLSGVAAGPAILIVGVLFDRKMKELQEKAKANAAEFKSAIAEIEVSSARLRVTREAAEGAAPILKELRARLEEQTKTLGSLADENDDVQDWSEENQQQLRVAGNLAGVVVGLASSPLIDEDGELQQRFKDAAERAARLV